MHAARARVACAASGRGPDAPARARGVRQGEICDIDGRCVDAAEDEVIKLTTKSGKLAVEVEKVRPPSNIPWPGHEGRQGGRGGGEGARARVRPPTFPGQVQRSMTRL